MKNLFNELKKYGKYCFFAPAFKLAEAILELAVPFFVADVIDRGINGGNERVIITDVAIMVALGVVGLLFSVAGQFYSAKAAVAFSSDVKSKAYKKLLDCPPSKTDKIGVPSMITIMTSDVNRLKSGVNLFLRLLLRSPFVVIGAVVAAMIIDAKTSWVFLVMTLALCVIVAAVMAITLPAYSRVQNKLDEVSSAARDNLTGARVIRAFGAEERENSEYRRRTGALEKMQNKVGYISSLLNPLTFVTVNISIVILLRVGALRVYAGDLTQGQTIALYDYMSQILVELVKFANLVITISKAVASGKRLEKVLNLESATIKEDDGENSPYHIEFRDVSVRYGEGGDSLSHINFGIERGQTVGVIGGTGSGKSTLVNLIPRLYDAYDGKVFVKGKNVLTCDVKELRKNIGIVLQKPALFGGTIADNVKLGNANADDKAVAEAIRDSAAEDVVASKEGGLNADVVQGGKNFSGGQRQRLSIARALARKPEILILDDSSSALDFSTDLKLRKSIAALDYKPTVIIVSQRASSVAAADKIIVLDKGRAVGIGTDEELYENCEIYREIRDSQKRGAI